MYTLAIVLSTVGSLLVAFLMFVIERSWTHMVKRSTTRLEERRRKLIATRNDINEWATFAGSERQTSRREVERWLVKATAESIEAEVQSIQTKLSEWRTNYGGPHSYRGVFKRVRLDLQVLEKDREVTKLLHQEFFKDVADEPPLPQGNTTGQMPSPLPESHERSLPPSPPRHRAAVDQELPITTPVQGMQPYLHQILQYLNEHEVNVIGIWGITGVGKTTLLKIINNYFAHNKPPLFDPVIFVVASEGVELEQLQKKIMESLGVQSATDSDIDSRATLLMDFLKDKKVLLLLDDLWEHVDMARLGIPLAEGACKVVFATRSESVRYSMRVDKSLIIECLNIEEALRLFKETVGEETIKADPSIQRLAEQVVVECAGLPLALIVLGRAMSTKKTRHEWQNLVELLRQWRLHDTSDTLDASRLLQILEFSYQNLMDDGGEGPSSLDP